MSAESTQWRSPLHTHTCNIRKGGAGRLPSHPGSLPEVLGSDILLLTCSTNGQQGIRTNLEALPPHLRRAGPQGGLQEWAVSAAGPPVLLNTVAMPCPWHPGKQRCQGPHIAQEPGLMSTPALSLKNSTNCWLGKSQQLLTPSLEPTCLGPSQFSFLDNRVTMRMSLNLFEPQCPPL
jgi:hypothetical protein